MSSDLSRAVRDYDRGLPSDHARLHEWMVDADICHTWESAESLVLLIRAFVKKDTKGE